MTVEPKDRHGVLAMELLEVKQEVMEVEVKLGARVESQMVSGRSGQTEDIDRSRQTASTERVRLLEKKESFLCRRPLQSLLLQ